MQPSICQLMYVCVCKVRTISIMMITTMLSSLPRVTTFLNYSQLQDRPPSHTHTFTQTALFLSSFFASYSSFVNVLFQQTHARSSRSTQQRTILYIYLSFQLFISWARFSNRWTFCRVATKSPFRVGRRVNKPFVE